jgi:cation:H+ antiporter
MSVSGNDLAAVLGAAVLAAIGGEAFLRGILGAAVALRVPKLLVATTLAAFATSSPELTVSTMAALSGAPEIGLGDALGSNVVNVALIFGLALLFGPVQARRDELGRDYVLTLLIPLLTFWFAADHAIRRAEGLILLLLFAGWMGLHLRAAAAHRQAVAATDSAAGSTHPPRSPCLGSRRTDRADCRRPAVHRRRQWHRDSARSRHLRHRCDRGRHRHLAARTGHRHSLPPARSR